MQVFICSAAFPTEATFSATGETGALFFSAISLVYSLIVAFVIVAAWDDYEELRDTVSKEADRLSAIVSDSRLMPDSLRVPIVKEVAAYAQMVADREWTTDQRRLERPPSLFTMRSIVSRHMEDQRLRPVLERLSLRIEETADLRRERLSNINNYIPGLVWAMLFTGTILMMVFSYYLETDQPRLQYVWTTMLSAMLGICLFVVYLLDHPLLQYGLDTAPYHEVIRIAGE